jgi:DNA-binding response OmpR family regulator
MNDMKNILVIYDSNTTLILLVWTLKKEGYEVQVAQSVNEARKIIIQRKPDLVILDLSMPDVSGYDFLKMRPEIKLLDVPIIVVSAIDSKKSVRLTQQLGAVEFMSKPFVVSEIVEAVKRHL